MLISMGDLMVDVFKDGAAERRHVGGKAAIWALTASVIGRKTEVLGAVGRDEAAEELLRVLNASGVGTSQILRTNSPTGADFFSAGEWRMERGANWDYSADDVRAGLGALSQNGETVDAVIIGQGLESATAEAALKLSQKHGWMTVLNLGPEADESRRRIDPAFFSLADVVVVNQREAAFLHQDLGLTTEWDDYEQLAAHLFAVVSPRTALILVRATAGAVVVVRTATGVKQVAVPPVTDRVVDPERSIGAGDSMLGAALALAVGAEQPLAAHTLEAALAAGARVAEITHRFRGTLTAAVEVPEEIRAARK